MCTKTFGSLKNLLSLSFSLVKGERESRGIRERSEILIHETLGVDPSEDTVAVRDIEAVSTVSHSRRDPYSQGMAILV